VSAPAIPTPQDQAFLDVDSPGPDTAYIEGMLLKFEKTATGGNVATSKGVIAQGFIKAGAARVRWGGQSTLMRVSPNNLPVSLSPWTFTAQGQMFRTPYMAVLGFVRAEGDEFASALLMDAATSSATHLVLALGGGQLMVVSVTKALSVLGEKTTFFPAQLAIDLQTSTVQASASPDGIYLPSSGRVDFVREPVAPGQYVMAAYVEDFWGNTQVSGQVVEIGARATP
jgi:hypothetical protein